MTPGDMALNLKIPWHNLAHFCCAKILLPSARHLEEGRGTTILELLRRENCISRLCPRPLGSPPPPPQHPNRVKNT